jgi:hypothetical protein
MLEVKQLYDVTYVKDNFTNEITLVAKDFAEAQKKITEAFKGASIINIQFGGPVCV